MTASKTDIAAAPWDDEPHVDFVVVEMRWRKAVSIDANEDSQAVVELLRRQAGIDGALASRS